jgi:glycosyltransferase involved in cell wall biosynthesis
MAHLLRLRRDYDVVVDVQNGVPFWAPLVTRRPVVNLVHHVHREQWPEVFGPVRARLGWWLESVASPRVYARSRYLVVSAATRAELAELGVAPERVDVVYSGRDETVVPVRVAPAPEPRLVVLGRLVPHKRVELAIDAVADLAAAHAGIGLDVVGHGYWLPELVRHAERRGVGDRVRFHGFVDEETKASVLAAAWVHVLPSLKEGWGLAILEAGALGVTSVAFRQASGTQESIVHGRTGLLVDDVDGFVAATGVLLGDAALRERLGAAAEVFASGFTWSATAAEVEILLRRAVSGADVVPLPARVAAAAVGTVGSDNHEAAG